MTLTERQRTVHRGHEHVLMNGTKEMLEFGCNFTPGPACIGAHCKSQCKSDEGIFP